MQASINYNYYAQEAINFNAAQTSAIIKKEAAKKIALFSGILVCLLLAVII